MALQDILKNTAAYLSNKSKEALAWYKEKVLKISSSSNPREPDNVFKKVSVPEIGKMYLYTYNPLTREKLPFFDMYPLVIPLSFYSSKNGKGFLGLNLHYLPPLQRAALLQTFIESGSLNNNNMDVTTRFVGLDYDMLTRKFKNTPYEVCIKRYLFGHVVSSFHEINANDWDRVVLLPLQKWVVNPNNQKLRTPY